MKARIVKHRCGALATGIIVFLVGWVFSGCCLHARHHRGKLTRDSDTGRSLQTRLQSSVEALAGDIGERNVYRPDKAARAAEWIVGKFEQAGFSNIRTQSFALHDVFKLDATSMAREARNLEVELAGNSPGKGVIVIGAHYDTLGYTRQWSGDDTNQFRLKFPGTPGANDNASGVAALIELARLLKESAAKKTTGFQRTIRFVAFDNEEPPFFQEKHLMGSSVYAQQSRAWNEKIAMMISLDTMGVYSRSSPNDKRPWYMALLRPVFGLKAKPDYVAFMSNWDAGSGKKTVVWAKSFARHSRIDVRTLSLPFIPSFGKEVFAWSDDWSFTRVGYPAFTVTDTAFYRSDRYHELWDAPQNITPHDYECFARVVSGLAGMLEEMADAP